MYSIFVIYFLILGINFEVISKSDLQSIKGVEFNTENSHIFIPNVAIIHQIEKEGK